jgi:two-component system phosphate regulon response regulator PhoB
MHGLRADLLVLVVEDATDLRDLFAAEMKANGFRVIAAADGEEAIGMARHFEPDAIVLDLMLPRVNGFDVARILRADERMRRVAMVAVTAFASNRLRSMALEAGCDSCLRKPVLGAALVGEVMRALVRVRPFRP